VRFLPKEIRLVDGIILLIVLLVFSMIFGRLVSPQRFNYDESDYMYAASKGLLASYLDRPSISVVDFMRTGIQRGLHSSEWRGLSDYIRQRDDITLYRHFHAPLYFYWLRVFQMLFGSQEFRVRWTSMTSLMLMASIFYFGSFALLGRAGRLLGMLAAGLLLMSPTNIETARWISPHSLYSACSLATLLFLAKLVQTNDLRFLFGSLVCLGLALATIEYAPLLVLVLLMTVYLRRSALFPRWSPKELFRFWLLCGAMILFEIAAFWPAGLYKLDIVKNYLFFLYFATIRSHAAYGTESLAHLWWARIVSSPVEYFVLISMSCYFLYLFWRRRAPLELTPFFLYATLMFLTTLRNRSESAYYVSSLVAALDFVSAYLLWMLLQSQHKLRSGIVAFILLVIAANNFYFYYRPVSRSSPDETTTALIDMLSQSGVQEERLLVPRLYQPMVHYYFQGANISSYPEDQTTQQIFNELRANGLEGLVYEGTDFDGLGKILQTNWSVQSVIKPESDRLGRAVAYYRLRSMR